VPESTGSDAVAAHPAGIGRGRPRAGYPCYGLLGHLTLRPPVDRPRDRVAADPSRPTRGCQLPTQLSDGCGRSPPGVGGPTLAHASSAGLPAPGCECRLRPLCFTSLRPSGFVRACSDSGRLGCPCKHGASQPRIRLWPPPQDGVARRGCQPAELVDYLWRTRISSQRSLMSCLFRQA
jgi:hypothetical protein